MTRPWSPDQGKTREMTKLCNHKRKLLLPTTAAASPVASCTPAVSSSALSAGPGATAIHVNADSPTSPDKARKGKSVTLRVLIPSSSLISTYRFFSLFLSLSFEKRALTRIHSSFHDLHNSDKRRVDWKLWIEKMLLPEHEISRDSNDVVKRTCRSWIRFL